MVRRSAKLQAMEAPSGVSGDGSGLSRVGFMPEWQSSLSENSYTSYCGFSRMRVNNNLLYSGG